MHRFATPHKGLCAGAPHAPHSAETSPPAHPDAAGGTYSGGMTSCSALLAAADDTRITATEFRILAVIAKGYRTRADIAKGAGCAESSVPRAVRKMEALGLLKRTLQPGKANAYVLADTPADTPQAKPAKAPTDTRIAPDTPASGDTRIPQDTAHILRQQPETTHKMQARGITLDTPQNPPKRSKTPLEVYPVEVEASGEVVVVAHASSDRPPPPVWQRVTDAVGSPWLDPNKTQSLILEGYVVANWLRDGADEHLDIVPTVRRLIERKRAHVPWSYFDRAVREAAARRLASANPNPITPAEVRFDQSSSYDGPEIRRPKISASTAILLRQMQS